MSNASPPRTSPTTRRSGRIRSAARTSSRTLTAPAPSALAVRASSRTTCGWPSRSSAVSSIVTMRSPRSIASGERVRARGLARARRARDDDVPSGADHRLEKRHRGVAEPEVGERDQHSPRTGGSSGTGRRARAVGAPRAGATRRGAERRPSATARSSRRPSGAMTRWAIRTIASASSSHATRSSRPWRSTNTRSGPFTMISLMRRIREQRLQRTETVDLGDELVENERRRRVVDERLFVVEQRVEPRPQLARREHGGVERRREQPLVQRVAERSGDRSSVSAHAASSRPMQPTRRSTSRAGRAERVGESSREHTGIDRASGRRARRPTVARIGTPSTLCTSRDPSERPGSST